MNRPTLHRGGFPSIDPATIGKAFKDGRAYRAETVDDVLVNLRGKDFDRPTRHITIGQPITYSRLIRAFALALVAFLVIYFGGHYAVAVLS